MIKNLKNKSNKRAVTRFTALFICMILVCGIVLPFIVNSLSANVSFKNPYSGNNTFYIWDYYNDTFSNYRYITVGSGSTNSLSLETDTVMSIKSTVSLSYYYIDVYYGDAHRRLNYTTSFTSPTILYDGCFDFFQRETTSTNDSTRSFVKILPTPTNKLFVLNSWSSYGTNDGFHYYYDGTDHFYSFLSGNFCEFIDLPYDQVIRVGFTSYHYANGLYGRVALYNRSNHSLYKAVSTNQNEPTHISLSELDNYYIKSYTPSGQAASYCYLVIDDDSGYTLSFDSQGGSSIPSLTGVSGIVHLGESGQYYPQYIPTKYGYDFIGWSLTENGTVVWDVDVQADTTLYARWSISSQYVNITFGDGFYEDSSCIDDLAGYFGVKGETLTFYAKKKLYQYTDITYDPLEHFYGTIHYSIGSVGYDMTGEMISGSDNPTEERIYKYTLYLDDSYYIQVQPAPLYKCWFRFNTTDYQEFNTGINYVAWYGQTFAPLWYRETNAYLYTTDSYLGMDLEVWIRLPYIINKPVVFDPAALIVEDYDQQINYDLRFSEQIVEDNTAYGATIHYHIIANPFQAQDSLEENEYVNIILLGKAISDYDITDEYSAIIVYDENSNASWAFSEVELLDTNWSEVNENIPAKLNSFFGGLFSLSGLAVLIPMVMMVSFAIWFIRRS